MMKAVIKFAHHFSKLRLDVFTTLRPYSPEKFEHYTRQIGKKIDIEIMGNIEFEVELLLLLEVGNPNELPGEFIEFDTDSEWAFKHEPHMLLLLRRVWK